MTDCFIMIHVIIFFVGVTDRLSGKRRAWFGRRQHRGCRCWYPKKCSVQRGNLCSWVFVGLGCVHGITVYNSRWFGGDTPICMVGSHSRGTAEPDPAAETVTALTAKTA